MCRESGVGMVLTLTNEEARYLMLAAQRLFDKPIGNAGIAQLRAMVEHLGVVQIDTISVVQRSQYLVLWSRLGPYSHRDFDSLLSPQRAVLEYWAHAASILPMRDYPYHRAWMLHHAHHMWPGNQAWMSTHAEVLQETVELLRARGPLASADFERPVGKAPTGPWDWYGPKDHRRALEILWTAGDLMVYGRRSGQKVFALREQVLAEAFGGVLPRDEDLPSLDERRRYLASRTVEALGVVTPSWLWDYFRLTPPAGRNRRAAALAQLQQFEGEGMVVPATIMGIEEPAFLSRAMVPMLDHLRAGAAPTRTTLLSPFDNLIWHRERARALFEYEVCFEAYVAPPKRRYGYYCLAILHRGRIIGRINPKMVRTTRTLLVRALYLEPSTTADDLLIRDLATALCDLARHLGAEHVQFGEQVPPLLSTALEAQLRGILQE